MKGKLGNTERRHNLLIAEFAVPGEFTFLSGEYVQVILGNGKKRYFSVASSPHERGIIRIATRPSESLFKQTLAEMPLGTEVQVNGPWGDLILPKQIFQPLIFIAGGIGITPFLSMLGHIAHEKLAHQITLLHFNRNEVPFRKELETLAGRNPRINLHFFSSLATSPSFPPQAWGGKSDSALYFLAGPPGFVNRTLNLLAGLNITSNQIIYESYTGY